MNLLHILLHNRVKTCINEIYDAKISVIYTC